MLVHGKPFQTSLMLASKVRVYPNEAPLRQVPGLTHDRLERPDRDKQSSLLRKFINYGFKSFITWDPSGLFLKYYINVTRQIKANPRESFLKGKDKYS